MTSIDVPGYFMTGLIRLFNRLRAMYAPANPYRVNGEIFEARPLKEEAELSPKQDTCPVCGASVSNRNLARHYLKVHPKRATSLSRAVTGGAEPRRLRNRQSRKLLFYGLLGACIILISIVAVQSINANTVRLHLQPQLSVLVEGVPITVPSGIGINQSLWKDHSLDHYGVAGHSPLTTHDTSGTIYVDSNAARNFTLQEFLSVWGETVDSNQVVGNPVPQGSSSCIIVNGRPFLDTRDVVLTDTEKVTVEIIQGSCSYLS